MLGPHGGKCASPLCGPGILMLGLASNEGLGGWWRNERVDMNLKDLAAWLQNMNELTGGCVLDMRATERGGLTLDLSWRQDGRAMGYEHAVSGIELRQMRDSVQFAVLEQIGHRVSSMKKPPNVRAEAGPTATRQARAVENAPAHCAGLAF